ncbi:MAG: DUF2752 domain-containing protein [Bacteroidetes bacterium]|nr:DUF2752 domain-containing protein [Bacteroidota bacterium]
MSLGRQVIARLGSVRPVWWIWGGAILAVGFVLSIDPHHPGESLCYSQRLFGLACPACGMGRAFNALLHIHLTDALAFNPLVFPVALFVAALLGSSLHDAIKGTSYTSRLVNFRYSWPVAVVAIAIVVLVWIRNLSLY